MNLRSLWDFDHPDISEKRFRDLLLETDGKVSCDFHCEILTQIARAEGLQGAFDRARETLHQVKDLLDETTNGRSFYRVRPRPILCAPVPREGPQEYSDASREMV